MRPRAESTGDHRAGIHKAEYWRGEFNKRGLRLNKRERERGRDWQDEGWERKYCSSVRIHQRRQWHSTPGHLPGKSNGRRSLVGCSWWGLEESDATEQLHFHLSLSCIGEGNGNPLQWSCLENPRDGGAWWAVDYGVACSRTRLKWLSSISRDPSTVLRGVQITICMWENYSSLGWVKEGRHLKGWQIIVPKAPTEQQIVSVSTNHIENCVGISLEIQRLTLRASTAGGVGLTPGCRAKIPRAAQCRE